MGVHGMPTPKQQPVSWAPGPFFHIEEAQECVSILAQGPSAQTINQSMDTWHDVTNL
jgi:hypothetical protein